MRIYHKSVRLESRPLFEQGALGSQLRILVSCRGGLRGASNERKPGRHRSQYNPAMRIAVTSQDTVTVTGHAGRCRRFLVFEVTDGRVAEPTTVEIDEAQTFHGSHEVPAALQGIGALITGGMGEGLFNRLTTIGVTPVVTTEPSPRAAVTAFVAGTLVAGAPHAHGPNHHH